MTGWNLCKQCRAVTWKDAVGRTFGCAIGCSNARTHNETNANPKPKIAGVERANDTSQPSGPPINMPYSPDTRGDCRPQWTGEGTGNFTIPQSVRFPPRKRRPGEDLQYDTSGTIGARKEPVGTAFKDQIKRNQIESFNPPPAVGPATYLRHRMGDVEGDEYKKTYSAGVMMRCTAARDIYGAGGMANLRSQCSPTNTNAYFAHDSKKEWKKRHAQNPLPWASKGSSFGTSARFKKQVSKTPSPGQYHDLHNGPLSCVLKKQCYMDLDQNQKPSTYARSRPYTIG